jgi:hypothetical protein
MLSMTTMNESAYGAQSVKCSPPPRHVNDVRGRHRRLRACFRPSLVYLRVEAAMT